MESFVFEFSYYWPAAASLVLEQQATSIIVAVVVVVDIVVAANFVTSKLDTHLGLLLPLQCKHTSQLILPYFAQRFLFK